MRCLAGHYILNIQSTSKAEDNAWDGVTVYDKYQQPNQSQHNKDSRGRVQFFGIRDIMRKQLIWWWCEGVEDEGETPDKNRNHIYSGYTVLVWGKKEEYHFLSRHLWA